MENIQTLQQVIPAWCAWKLPADCLTGSAKLIGSRGGYEIYELACGDYFMFGWRDVDYGSSHLVTADDLNDLSTDEARIVGAAVNLTGDDLDVVFDNGGLITVQGRGFVHSYDDPKQAAEDVKFILAPDYDPSQWDSYSFSVDEPTCYQGISADPEIERNGGYNWMDRGAIQDVIELGELEECHGYAMRDFFQALGVVVTDENYSTEAVQMGKTQTKTYTDGGETTFQADTASEALVKAIDWAREGDWPMAMWRDTRRGDDWAREGDWPDEGCDVEVAVSNKDDESDAQSETVHILSAEEKINKVILLIKGNEKLDAEGEVRLAELADLIAKFFEENR